MKLAVPSVRSLPSGFGTVALVFVLLLAARVLGLISVYFFEEDEVSIAVGAAALVADTSGFVYRYTVQLGYYRLIEGLDLILGGRIDLIPWIMKFLSAFAGAWIPVAGFFAFRADLTIRQRWLVVLTLAVNPIIWRSSQYGNAAIVATALATTGLIMLSNRPSRSRQAGALALVGLGILVRADAVLLTPIVFFLLRDGSGSTIRAIKTSAAFAVAMTLLYGALFIVDPRIDSAAQSVSTHMLSTPNQTMFWEFFLWAISPIPLIFAIWGFRGLLERQPRLVVFLLVWCVPTLLFYFRATTTCRYFLNVALPFAIAAAVGMDEIAARARTWTRASIAWAAVIGLATLHLVVALGRVPSNRPAELFYGGTFITHDGPMPTGALLARTYLTPGALVRGLPRPQFGKQDYPFWEGVSYTKAVDLLADPAAPRRTVVVLLSGGFAHAFHFHTHAAGARYHAGPSSPDVLWAEELWMQLGNTRVMTVATDGPAYAGLKRIDLRADDLVWVLGEKPFPDAATLAKMPSGLTLQPTQTFDSRFRTFRVSGTASTGK